MFHIWSELVFLQLEDEDEAMVAQRYDSRSLCFWICWKAVKFQVSCSEGKLGQIFFDENTLENQWRKQHVAEKSVSLYIITDAHLCNIIQQGTHRIHESDVHCEKGPGIRKGKMISMFLSLFQGKILT